MGGAAEVPGNITPVAEANIWNDAVAAARVFALSSPDPASTMPLSTQHGGGDPLGAYPKTLSRQLNVKIFPLDITLPHYVDYTQFRDLAEGQINAGGPLATFVDTFLGGIFKKVQYQYGNNASHRLTLHDPLTVWYALTPDNPAWELATEMPADIRVETTGQWTGGMLIVDRRGKRRAAGGEELEIIGDDAGWLSAVRGNRIDRMKTSPGPAVYHSMIMEKLFGL